ncbi:MAG: hypothetical protein SGJ19_22005 [Planctomycetia bacterium]|nr:hypothetical protein [Planctomycetia bacterium]
MRNAVTDLERSLRHRDDQVIRAQEELKELLSRLALSDREKSEIVARLDAARHDIAAAEQRAALAEQRASLVEQLAATAPTRAVKKVRVREARAGATPSA